MRRSALLVAVILALVPALAMAQVDSSLDTLTVLESTQISYDGQLVDYFLLSTVDLDLRFIEDSAYIKLLGFIEAGDTADLPEAVVWMKTANPMIGDSWTGMIPSGDILPTDEMIVAIKEVTVTAGTFTVFAVGVWDLGGTYLGEKWWSDGVGLVGWDLTICNETENLEAISKNTAPSSDFWPHTVGDEYVIRSLSGYSTVSAEFRTLTVDGNNSDWAGIAPVVQDPSGDDTTGFTGCDIRDLYVAADDTYLYLMVDFWDGPPNTAWGSLAVPAYAFLLDDDGAGTFWGFEIGYAPAPTSSWFINGITLDATGAEVACGSVMEVRIPLVNIGSYGFQLPGYYFAVNSDYDFSCWNTVLLPAYCPISVSGDANGDFEVKSSDVIYLVNYVLKAGPEPLPCPAAGDANGDGQVKSSDIIHLVNYVFKAGPPPADICALIPGVWSCP